MKKIKNAVIFLLFAYPLGIFIGVVFWLSVFLRITKVHGWKNFPSWQGKVLVVSNHPSLLDPIILVGLFFHQFFLRPFKYGPWNMAEQKNYGGWLFYPARTRLILIERENRRSKARGFIQAKNILNSSGVMIIFPEGGRTSSGGSFLVSKRGNRIRRFNSGFARIAIETGATVLPVWVEGTDQVLPNDIKVSYFRFPRFWKKVVIKIGQPLKFRHESSEEIRQTVEKAVLELADQKGD